MIPSYSVRVRVRCGNFVDSYLGMTLNEDFLLFLCIFLFMDFREYYDFSFISIFL